VPLPLRDVGTTTRGRQPLPFRILCASRPLALPLPFLEGSSPAASPGALLLEPPPAPPLPRRGRRRPSPDAATPGDGVENLGGTVVPLAAACGELMAAVDAEVVDAGGDCDGCFSTAASTPQCTFFLGRAAQR